MSVKADCGNNKGICSLDQEIDESGSHLELAVTEGTHRRQKSASLDGLWAKQQLLLPPQMTTKVKGLFKGLRYISQIFEQPNMKEQEMQIGYPTDVKHVAHIGWDGPSVTAPSWMNEFRATPEFNSTPLSSIDDGKELGSQEKAKLTSQDGMPASPPRDVPELPKASRRHHASVDSASREGSGAPRQSRRSQQTSGDPSVPRQSRRHHSSSTHGGGGGGGGGGGTESPTKASRRRKPKNAAGGGSTRAGRTKALASAGADQDARTEEQAPDLKSTVEEEGN